MTETAPPAPAPDSVRRRLLTRMGLAFGILLIVWGLWWALLGRFTEQTDNAYVKGDLVEIHPQVSGTVVAILVRETDRVTAGTPLLRLGDADATTTLMQAEAGYADALRRGMAAKERTAALRAERDRTEAEYRRRIPLAGGEAVSAEDLQKVRTDRDVAARDYAEAEVQSRGPVEELPPVRVARAALRAAYLAKARTVVVAPFDGIVARIPAEVGGVVDPRTPVAAMVDTLGLQVEANFKENQLRNLRIGQPVQVKADLYGGSVTYEGKVAGIVPGTGGIFSLIPPQNATGNWIKVVQRVPVLIDLERGQVDDHPLFPGLSLRVAVDTGDREGELLAAAPVKEPSVRGTTVYGAQLDGFDDLVSGIADDLSAREKP